MHAANAYNMLVLCCIATPACLTVVAAPFFGRGVAGKTVLQDGGVERVYGGLVKLGAGCFTFQSP